MTASPVCLDEGPYNAGIAMYPPGCRVNGARTAAGRDAATHTLTLTSKRTRSTYDTYGCHTCRPRRPVLARAGLRAAHPRFTRAPPTRAVLILIVCYYS